MQRIALGRRRSSHFRSSRIGSAVVEMAIVLPIFVLIVFGIVEFGRAMMVSQLLTNGARHGARTGIVDGTTNADVTADVKSFLSQALGVPAADIQVTIEVEPGTGNPDPNDVLAAAQSKDIVKVKVQVGFDKVSYVTGNFLNGKMLEGYCVMRHE
ncbi:MAG: TadE/TadG family type IV pilus assembly protein [Planctomycetaceae bacterium]